MKEDISVQRQVQALRGLRKTKQIDAAVYGKMVVCLALVYVDAKMLLEALELLRTLPLEYYTEFQLGQMLADAEFEDKAAQVADAMVAAGFDQPPLEILPTMPGGNA